MYSVKVSVPQSLCSPVIYKFTCAGCNAYYIGETTYHICMCLRAPCVIQLVSHVNKHLQSSGTFFDSYSVASYTIIDSAALGFQVEISGTVY